MYTIESLGFDLPELPFAYNALEPYMDEETMKIHHGKHHKAYSDKFKEVAEKHGLGSKVFDLVKNIDKVPKEAQKGIRNFGGGHVNHAFFWTVLKKGVDKSKAKEVMNAIDKKFSSYEKFVEAFTTASSTFFGSGWTWLVVNKSGDLEIVNTANQESPISNGQQPILCLDLWEHSYYVKWRWNRLEYIKTFFNIINWEQVNNYYKSAKNY